MTAPCAGGRCRLLVFAVLWRLLLAPAAEALDPHRAPAQFGLRSWTEKEGLSDVAPVAIAQTSEGYLWLAGAEGLTRFDGVSFTRIELPTAAPGAAVHAMVLDRRGTLWIASDAGLFSRRGESFVRSDVPDAAGRRITSLAAGVERGLWLAFEGGGLGRLERGGLRVWGPEHGLPDATILALHQGRSGLWIAAGLGGLWRYGPQTDRFEALPAPPSSTSPEVLHEDRQGRLWVGGGGGLVLVTGEATTRFGVRDGLPTNDVQSILEDLHGNLWIGTLGRGLLRFRPPEGPDESPQVESLSVNDGLPGNDVVCLFEDVEGHLWIGVRGAGLSLLRDVPFTTLSLAGGADGYQGVTSVYHDAGGEVWIATLTGGLRHLRADGSLEVVGRRQGLPTDRLWAVHRDRRGDLWIGTSGAGAVRLRAREPTVYTVEDGLPHNVVFGFYESRDGSLWMTSNGGLGRWHAGKFEVWTVADGLSTNLTRAIVEDRDGDLWIGTSGGGVNRLRGEALRADRDSWRPEDVDVFTAADGLSSDNVWTLHSQADGTLWLGTSGGLDHFSGGVFRGMDTRHGLLSDDISAIVEDDGGDLWLGTRRGIMRLRRHQLEEFFAGRRRRVLSLRYGLADGLRNTEVYALQSNAWKAPDGRLWFPTLRGVSVIDPTAVRDSGSAAAVRIEGVLVDGEARPAPESLTLEPDTKRLEVVYSTLSLKAPERLRFRHRLLGFDRHWIEAGNRRSASYTNLPPGRYTFQVAYRNEDSDWHSELGSLTVVLRPRFYQHRAFLPAAVLVLLIVLRLAHRLRLAQLRRRELELERRVEEARKQVDTLAGLLPICSACKRVRDDRGYWSQLEQYVSVHSSTELTHGICPSCYESMMEEVEAI